MAIWRPSIRPAMSLARLATLSWTLSSSSRSERGTGRNRLLGRCMRTLFLSLSASFSRRTISCCTASTRAQSSTITASKNGTRFDAHSWALVMCCCIGPMGERPNRLTKGFTGMRESPCGKEAASIRTDGKGRQQLSSFCHSARSSALAQGLRARIATALRALFHYPVARRRGGKRLPLIPRTFSFTSSAIAMNTETEIKLRVSRDTLAALREHPLLKKRNKSGWERHELANQYFDTPEHALAAARVALRLRKDGEQHIQTLKTRGNSIAGLSQRGEWEWPLEKPKLDLKKLDEQCWPQSLAELDKKQLKPLFSTNFTREKAELAWGRGKARTVIEAALD